MSEIKPDDLWELLHEIAPCIPFSKPDLYRKVQDVLDGGVQGILMGAAKEQVEELVTAGKRVIDRHDIGSLGAKGDSVSIEMLRGVIEKASATSAERSEP